MCDGRMKQLVMTIRGALALIDNSWNGYARKRRRSSPVQLTKACRHILTAGGESEETRVEQHDNIVMRLASLIILKCILIKNFFSVIIHIENFIH